MKIEEIKTIIKLMSENDLTEFKIEAEDMHLCLKRGGQLPGSQIIIPAAAPVPAAAPAAPAAPAAAPAAPAASKKTKPAVKKNTPAAPREETIRETQSVISTETIVS